MSLRRVVVTGLGALTPVGNSVPEFWDGLVSGKSGSDLITRFDTTNFKTKFACEVKDFDVQEIMDRKEARRMDPFVHYAIASSDQAIKNLEKHLIETIDVINSLGATVWIIEQPPEQQLLSPPDQLAQYSIRGKDISNLGVERSVHQNRESYVSEIMHSIAQKNQRVHIISPEYGKSLVPVYSTRHVATQLIKLYTIYDNYLIFFPV